ncbi:hypothetical protein ACRQ5Q_22480 [Bradyrhizobium sp. PMVTL-01]|uniref:hypothetical protein n=1 Tax=Bradyrhizobium sp. PMVTL-01 TaxID=3434999 RepID=UPI003F711145
MSRIINRDAVKIGQHLRSKAVGKKSAFVGEVVEVRADTVILRDAQRRRWLREWHEVETLK